MTTSKITTALGVLFLAGTVGCQTTPHRPAVNHAAKSQAAKTAPPKDSVAARPVAQQSSQQPAAAKSLATPENFDRKREEADYASALARWEEGDSRGCRAVLTSLVKRRPDHREANLLFAELCLLEDTAAEGLICAERVCTRDPADAQAQHTRGLLLEALGRHNDAIAAYQLAVKHAPGDDIYLASLEAAGSRPAPEGVFVAGNRPRELPTATDASRYSAPPASEPARLNTLRRDMPGRYAATVTDE